MKKRWPPKKMPRKIRHQGVANILSKSLREMKKRWPPRTEHAIYYFQYKNNFLLTRRTYPCTSGLGASLVPQPRPWRVPSSTTPGWWRSGEQNPQTRTAAQNALSQSRVNGAWDLRCGPAGVLRCGPAGVLRCGPAGFCVIALLRGPAGRLFLRHFAVAGFCGHGFCGGPG